jgi:hypothetical protein
MPTGGSEVPNSGVLISSAMEGAGIVKSIIRLATWWSSPL